MPTRRQHKGGNGNNHKDASQNTVIKQVTTSPSVQQPQMLSSLGPGPRQAAQAPAGLGVLPKPDTLPLPPPLLAASCPVLPLLLPPPSPGGSPFPRTGTVRLVVPNTGEVGVLPVKARTTPFLDVPFPMGPKVHFTLEVAAGFHTSHDSGLTGSSNSQSSAKT